MKAALEPYRDLQSIVLLNANFQLGYQYRPDTRRLDGHYWSIRQLMQFRKVPSPTGAWIGLPSVPC